MTKLTLEVPDNINLNEHDAIILLTGKLYELDLISLSQASEWVGLSKESFLEKLDAFESEKAFREDGFRLASQAMEERFCDEPDYSDVPLKEENPNFVPPVQR